MIYEKAELQRMIAGMRQLSSGFYTGATRIGNHAFIEFAGFMNEYIQLCERAMANGQDFTEANTHVGEPLAQEFNAAYIGEKFGCIFETTFGQKLNLIGEFCKQAFKVEAMIEDRGGQKVLVLRKAV